jgi:hypothetical protein
VLKIRKAQIQALGVEMTVTFEDRMTNWLQNADSSWCRDLGTTGLRDFIRHGVRQAQQYGLIVEHDVARYIIVMRQLGMRFDESQDYPWARALLTASMPPAEKLARLDDAILYQKEARKLRHAG